MASLPRLILGTEVCLNHGWGIHSYFLAKRIMERGIAKVESGRLDLTIRSQLALRHRITVAADWNAPTIYALGNHPIGTIVPRLAHSSDRTIHVFEGFGFNEIEIASLNFVGVVLTVAEWNRDVLRDLGVSSAVCSHLGVDTTFYKPSDSPVDVDRPFTIFSGGKAEFRKGQDIVVDAFRRFNERHPESRLVTAWHSGWPDPGHSLERSPHTSGSPIVGSGAGARLEIGDWLTRNGLRDGSWTDCGRYFDRKRHLRVLHSVDAALFPNRCEGGTNMVAMECIAAGVPTILSANSGHKDLLADDLGISLKEQGPVTEFAEANSYWGESNVDEVVNVLEEIYAGRAGAMRRAREAAERIEAWNWTDAMDRQIDALDLTGAIERGYP